MQQDMIADLGKLHSWFSVNKLPINVEKMNVMLFTHPRGVLKNATLNVTLDNREIESVNHFKYLGITLDRNLKFQEHARILKGKVDQRSSMENTFIYLPRPRTTIV